MGEELTSALNPGAARHWRELPEFDPAPALPACAAALSAFVQGPPALARSLSQIGVMKHEPDGAEHQTTLQPGQSLVSRSGAIWRWDGYTIRAGMPTQAAVRLQQRNRLSALRARLTVAEHDAATTRAEGPRLKPPPSSPPPSTAGPHRRRASEHAAEQARISLSALRNQAATTSARLASADDQLARITLERDETLAALARAREVHAALPDIAASRDAVNNTRAALSAARALETTTRTERDALLREHEARAARRHTIDAERGGWTERARDANERVTDLAARLSEAEDALKVLEARPAEVAARRAEALDSLQSAEAAHRRTAEALASALTQASEADRMLGRRRRRWRPAARRRCAPRAFCSEPATPGHRCGTHPGAAGRHPCPARPAGNLSQDSEDRARKRLERQWKEREETGPVNLRAEQEAEAVEQQIGSIESSETS